MMTPRQTPTVIRATDAKWSDRKHHDRLILRVADSDRMYQFEGWVRFGEDPQSNAFNVIAGISRQDRETGRLTLFVETHSGRWKPIGTAAMVDQDHIEVTLSDPQGATICLHARVLETLPGEMRSRLRGHVSLDEDETAQLDLEIQSVKERRSNLKVV